MTENMAARARGEGLAGLVAQHDPQLYSPQGPVSGINGTYTIAFLGCSCGWNSGGEASKTEKWSEHVVAALEAAAPPSTAQAQQEFTHDLFAAIHRTNYPGCGDCENFPTTRDVEMFDAIHKVLKRYALATPSPQAPPEQCNAFSTTSAREQSSATASGNPGAALADEILRRIARRYENSSVNIYPDMPCLTPVEAVLRCAQEEGFVLSSVVPAATQEQPAGSEAKELLKLVWRQYGIKGDIPAETLERIEKYLGENEIWTGDEELDDHFRRTGLLPDSPRKVGEDGAKVGDEVWVRGKLLRVDKGYLLVEVCDGGDSFDLLCRPLDVTPRSSSVPVGEQKQEEGV